MKHMVSLLMTGSLLAANAQEQPPAGGRPGQSQRTAVDATSSATLFQERLLSTLPPGVAVNEAMLPYSLLFAADGRQVTYFARYRAVDLVNEAVVHGGVRGPEGAFILQAALSPDAALVAYLMSFRDDIRSAYLVIGDRRDKVQVEETTTTPQWVPVFSPDGKKLAYKAETASGRHVVRVVDISDVRPDAHAAGTWSRLAVESGPEFDDVDQVRFGADGGHFTYAARNGRTWTIVVDRTPGATFRDADTPTLNPNGSGVAFRATRDGKKYFIVVGDREGPAFDMVSPVAFSRDGTRFAYSAREGDKYWLVNGADRQDATFLADQVVFSADGKHVACWKQESRARGRQGLIIDGKPGPEFDQVGWPVFDDAARVAAYWARSGNKFLMVAGDRVSARFDGVGRTRVFNADGSQLGFGVLQGKELRWKVMSTR